MDQSALDIPSVESHPVCPSVSPSLIEYRVLKFHPQCRECQGFSPFMIEEYSSVLEYTFCYPFILEG